MGFAGRNKNGLYELQCISKVRPRASPLRLRFFCCTGHLEYTILCFLLGSLTHAVH